MLLVTSHTEDVDITLVVLIAMLPLPVQDLNRADTRSFEELIHTALGLITPYLNVVCRKAKGLNNSISAVARMRRGILHEVAKENGCNKIALGHHLDDAAETFMMNLLIEGRVGCFAPVTYLSRRDITMIRPLVYVREKEVQRVAERLNLPVTESKCPADTKTKREDMKTLLKNLSAEQKYRID